MGNRRLPETVIGLAVSGSLYLLRTRHFAPSLFVLRETSHGICIMMRTIRRLVESRERDLIYFYGTRTFSQSVRLLAAGLLVSLLTHRQGLPQRPAKDAQFEVFSIRQSHPGTPQGSNAVIQPNGYQARGQSLWATLMLANFAVDFSEWRSEMLLGLPPWASSTLYDIDARVASAELPRWQQQDRSHELLSQMLRTALEERCHLVMHHVTGKEKIFALVVGRGGAKLTATRATEPEGIPFGEGRLIPGVGSIQLRGVSMKSLAQFLSRSSPRIVRHFLIFLNI
jgi:uncharacterized protein (TIGR03435 family)